MYDYGTGGTKIHMFRLNAANTQFTCNYTWFEVLNRWEYNAAAVIGTMAAGDFNHDGKDDIATMYNYGLYANIHVFLSKNTGDGSLC